MAAVPPGSFISVPGRSRAAIPALLLSLALAACATAPAPLPVGPGPAPGPVPGPASPTPPRPLPPTDAPDSPARLPGWSAEDHGAAFHAYLAGCGVARDADAAAVCRDARALAAGQDVTPDQARVFLESRFAVVAATTVDGGPGLLTAYFAPEYQARRRADAEFDMPVLGRPGGSATALPDRAAIEAGALVGRAPVLGWMRAEDLFFMQIQGSGYLTFEDGRRERAAYAADNGHRFVGIARPMADQGLLPENGTSGEAIRAWLAARRGPEARAVMALNPRYIFFAATPDDDGHPAGAAGIPLPPRRAIAVDPASWAYGDLVWIEADGGNLVGARGSYRGLVMALDTGSAIRGPVRADFYMGRGAEAGVEAGSVRHPLRMWRLVPRP